MEDSTPLQTLTAEPSASVFSFPPHRRRPLRSRTYDTLIQILSHCRRSTQGGTRQVSEVNETIDHADKCLTDVLAPNRSCNERGDDALVGETDIDKNGENVGCQDKCFESSGSVKLGMDELSRVADFWLDDGSAEAGSVQVGTGEKSTSSDLDFLMDGIGTLGELEFDKEFSICDFSEILDSCSGMDIVVESSKVGGEGEGNGSAVEDNRPKESEHERLLQLKAMELEKLLSDSGAVGSSSCGAGDEEMEEGEISGEEGVAHELLHASSEDDVSQADKNTGDKNTGVLHASEDNADKARGFWSHDMSDPSILNIASRDNDHKVAELRATSTQVKDNHLQNESSVSYMEVQRFGPASSSFGNLPSPGRDLQENGTGNISAASIEDGDLGKKKRKKGPPTKERKAKKKRKERIKRAEKNRELGIKRLKLQPVLKPKTISYCRHYLQGRCHEGEKCKFSHDTVPLTKSKPCSYFVRRSCMKGEECPFDHELSKYPCDKLTSQGYCGRGPLCLFSHEVSAKQSLSMTPSDLKPENHSTVKDKGSLMTSKVTQPYKSTSPMNNSNSSKNANNRGTSHLHIDAKFPAGESTKQLAEPGRTVRQIPKGVSFLSHGDGVLPKTGSVVDVHKTSSKELVSMNKNEISVVTAPRRPRGINFLSFAQKSPLDDTSRKMIVNFNSNGDNGKGKSVAGGLAAEEQSCSPIGSGGIIEVNKQISQSAVKVVQNLNEGASRIPIMTESRPITNLASGGASSGNLQDSIKTPSVSYDGPLTYRDAKIPISLKTSIFANNSTLVQKAVQSTLAFAAKFEPNIKLPATSTCMEASKS